MKPEEIRARGGLYYERITEAFAACRAESRYMGPAEAEKCLRALWEENGDDASFVDCYYPYLEKESQERVLSALSEEEAARLEETCREETDLIRPLDETLLRAAVRLIDTEMLFFTFYFLKTPCTVWGNYKQEYLFFLPKSV